MAISTDSSLPENRVKISEDLRSMNVPTGEQVLGCVGDAWVRRVWFDMPRYCDGTDLSTYNLSVNYRNSDDDEDRYTVTNATVGTDTITFSWLVGAMACAAPGLTSVSIKAQKLNGDTIEHEFNSTLYYFKVLPANTTGAEPLQEYSDAFTALMLQWQAEVENATDSANSAATAANSAAAAANDATEDTEAATAAALAAIEAMGDISELAVPEMSATIRGGAKVGSGLEVSNGALQLNGGNIGDAVDDWLDDHPEATTTVQDGSITDAKLVQNGGVLEEVQNIRTDAYGTAHTSAGDAVRAQVNTLSDETLFFVDGEEIALNPVSGHYATYNGWEVAHNGFFVTDAVSLNKGDKVRIYSQGYLTNVAVLSLVGNTSEPTKPYTPIIVGTDSNARWYETIIPSDGDYVISGDNAVTPVMLKCEYSFPSILDNIDNAIDNVLVDAGIYEIIPTMNVGYYATFNGWKVANSAFFVSESFDLVAGDYVSVYARGYQTNIAILAKISDPDNPSRPYTANISSDGDTAKWYRVKISENGTYVVSGNKDTAPIVRICTSGETIEKISYCDFSVFRKFGVIGDSYASGQMYFDDSFVNNYSISWGQILARMCGNVCTNYSTGGLTTRSWLTDPHGLSLMNSSPYEDLYILALGINDCYSLGQSYLGALTDITSHSSYVDYGDTFYGNYGKIIEQVKMHAPYAKLIMFTCASTESNDMPFNNAIEEIAEYYGIPCVVQYEHPFFMSPVYTNMSGGHPRAIAYSGMAVTFKKLIEDQIVNNLDYFSDMYMYSGA